MTGTSVYLPRPTVGDGRTSLVPSDCGHAIVLCVWSCVAVAVLRRRFVGVVGTKFAFRAALMTADAQSSRRGGEGTLWVEVAVHIQLEDVPVDED